MKGPLCGGARITPAMVNFEFTALILVGGMDADDGGAGGARI